MGVFPTGRFRGRMVTQRDPLWEMVDGISSLDGSSSHRLDVSRIDEGPSGAPVRHCRDSIFLPTSRNVCRPCGEGATQDNMRSSLTVLLQNDTMLDKFATLDGMWYEDKRVH